MELRKKIGNRISEARKAKGLTITELVTNSENLSVGRVSNWERGTRSPRPGEIILLAELLNVSANYLLCITDDPNGGLPYSINNGTRQVKVLSLDELAKVGGDLENMTSPQLITVNDYNSAHSNNLFAGIVDDCSMEPEFIKGDIIVADPQISPKPGDYVLVYLLEKKQIVFRKYREVQGCLFQLLAANELWAALDIKEPSEATLLGVIIEHRRFFKR